MGYPECLHCRSNKITCRVPEYYLFFFKLHSTSETLTTHALVSTNTRMQTLSIGASSNTEILHNINGLYRASYALVIFSPCFVLNRKKLHT
jgi:hypothetical protein